MVKIGYRPVLWHVMRYYAHFGHKEFVLCLGYKAETIKDFFLHYEEWISNDFTLSDGGNKIELESNDISDWKITFVDTGLHANIGQRLMAVRKHVEDEEIFLANYADGLTDLHLPDMVDSFRASDKVASFMAVPPSQSFHLVDLEDDGEVTSIRSVERVGPADQRRLLRAASRDLRLHVPGRRARARTVRAADEGAQAPRVPLRPLLGDGHLQGAAAALGPRRDRVRAVGGLEGQRERRRPH